MNPKKKKERKWSEQDHPLPWLRFLYSSRSPSPPDPNAHDGYALAKAVHANFVPLVSFLLDRGASPRSLAVMIAIRRRDLVMVRTLIERDGRQKGRRKHARRRRIEDDRIEVSLDMLRAAVECGALDIVRYFCTEKGCVPDMKTLQMMMMMAPPV
jgi:hypothetical protein